MNEYTIIVPKKIENTVEGFEFLINFINEVKNIRNSKIIIDFSKTRWLEANLTAVLGAIFHFMFKNNNKINLYRISNSTRKVLEKNGFLQSFGLESSEEDVYETTIKYTKFKNEDRVEFQEYLKNEFIPKINLTMTKAFSKELRLNLEEVFQNARTHGRCNNIYVCGQYYYSQKKVKFTIVDLGVTILENVKNKFNKELPADYAIDWATKDGNSTKIDESGGIGLYQLREFLRENGGRTQIVSSNGYWEEYDNKITHVVYKNSFMGTIVNIEVDINDKVYISKDEKNKINKIISNIF